MSNNKKRLIPIRRFNEFKNSDAWEQHKLGDVLQTLPFKQFLKEPEQDGKYEIVQQGNEPIIGYANGVPCSDYENIVIFGDHTLSLYKPKRPFFVATDGVRIVKGKNNLNGFYLMAILEKYRPQNEGYKRYYSILADQDCCLTENANEQQVIGHFFDNIDHLIALHQRKIDKLKRVKSAYLTEMFPAEGEREPKRRFPGFTGAWEQRKLGELTEFIRNGYSYKADGLRDHKYKLTRIESISSGEINVEKLGSSDIIDERYRLKEGDIVFSHINSLPYIGNHAIYTADLGKIYHGMNLLCIRSDKEKIEPKFLHVLLKTSGVMNYIQTHAKPAVNQCSLPTTEVAAMEISIPPIDEQKKIADFFANLDHLIALHQHKLDKLRKLKAAYLNEMFV